MVFHKTIGGFLKPCDRCFGLLCACLIFFFFFFFPQDPGLVNTFFIYFFFNSVLLTDTSVFLNHEWSLGQKQQSIQLPGCGAHYVLEE